ncbi:MAG: tRNA preQ1(34) S-adenosylmethionine ribosyltransferase-isomerase QueA [Proteobacteria bacterium]|nr:tRNA preQ1(34) S-adenosylmethionine ribosyltransferase-isomerase QueA [Pseudomonadota bacterium]
MYLLSDYAYDLPEDLIASHPEQTRDASRLLCLNRRTGDMDHRMFADVIDQLLPGDVLVMNNTRVIPARLLGFKDSGGKAEVLIIDYVGGMARYEKGEPFECQCLIKASKGSKPGTMIRFDQDFSAEVIGFDQGIYTVRFHVLGGFESRLDQLGRMPLPPYIKREDPDAWALEDRTRYQTVYASEKGAVAAPTAGLHFTEDLLDRIRGKGVETAQITLHVGYGTFVPVRVSDIRDHQIHSERFQIPEKSADLINQAKKEGRRIIAVGTTTVRTLEYAVHENNEVRPGFGVCDVFIYPGYEFKIIDAMVTNFHIPESTLLMLVSAFAGRDSILSAYRDAVKEKYRFYSYGDAMFIG